MADALHDNSGSVHSHPIAPRRRWRLVVALATVGFSCPALLDTYLVLQGLGPRSAITGPIATVSVIVNLPGALLAFCFGDPLAHPNAPIQKWNDFLFFAGSLTFWTLAGACLGDYLGVSWSRILNNRSDGPDSAPRVLD